MCVDNTICNPNMMVWTAPYEMRSRCKLDRIIMSSYYERWKMVVISLYEMHSNCKWHRIKVSPYDIWWRCFGQHHIKCISRLNSSVLCFHHIVIGGTWFGQHRMKCVLNPSGTVWRVVVLVSGSVVLNWVEVCCHAIAMEVLTARSRWRQWSV